MLAADAVPDLVLSPLPERTPRLGWNSWLPVTPASNSATARSKDGTEPIFEAELVEAGIQAERA